MTTTADQPTIRRICPGAYEVALDGRTVSVHRMPNGREWMASHDQDPFLYADPEPTKRAAAQVARDMLIAEAAGEFRGAPSSRFRPRRKEG